jgi:chorismate mutase
MNTYLEKQRERIDSLDNQIIGLLEKRFGLVKELTDWKKTKGLPIEDLEREKELVSKYQYTRMPKGFLAKYYQLLFDEAKK